LHSSQPELPHTPPPTSPSPDFIKRQQELERELQLENERRERERELQLQQQIAAENERRERELREKREREQREYEQREREREEYERKLREIREREIREQQEKEQREREQREREQREREQREREQREREQRERELQREKELQRERELQQQRERELREAQEREQREKFERELREEAERNEREKAAAAAALQPQQTSVQQAQSALAALTTIVVTGAEPEKAQIGQIESKPEKLPFKATSTPQKPYQIEETSLITTTTSTLINELHQIHEQIIEQHDPATGELNNEVIETDYTSTYIPDHEEIPRDGGIIDEDSQSQRSEFERQRREFAGNYSTSLVYNVYKELNMSRHKDDENSTSSTTKNEISNELKHLVDDISLSQKDESVVDVITTTIDDDLNQYAEKMYIFTKQLSKEQLEVKQPTLAQIIKNLHKEKFDIETSNNSNNEESNSSSIQKDISTGDTPAFSLGIKLKSKTQPTDVGNHSISYIEPDSIAARAGMKINSKIIKINDIFCEDKTHEFVLFFLNYILRKNSCEKIEITVREPVQYTTVITSSQKSDLIAPVIDSLIQKTTDLFSINIKMDDNNNNSNNITYKNETSQIEESSQLSDMHEFESSEISNSNLININKESNLKAIINEINNLSNVQTQSNLISDPNVSSYVVDNNKNMIDLSRTSSNATSNTFSSNYDSTNFSNLKNIIQETINIANTTTTITTTTLTTKTETTFVSNGLDDKKSSTLSKSEPLIGIGVGGGVQNLKKIVLEMAKSNQSILIPSKSETPLHIEPSTSSVLINIDPNIGVNNTAYYEDHLSINIQTPPSRSSISSEEFRYRQSEFIRAKGKNIYIIMVIFSFDSCCI
jgi:hypothetical protein